MTPEASKAKAEVYREALEEIDDALSRRWNDRMVLIRRIGEIVEKGLEEANDECI